MKPSTIATLTFGAAVVLASAVNGPVHAEDGPRPSAKVLACAKKALSPADMKALTSGAFNSISDSGFIAASTCFFTNGRTSKLKISPSAKVIVASPFDPAPVVALTKFRSCTGHDYSGLNIVGHRERDRSMKTYVDTAIPVDQAHAITAVAPFDGTIGITSSESGFGQQMTITNPKGWIFTYFHGDPLVTAGATVKAGSPVIAFPPAEKPTDPTMKETSFDMALQAASGQRDNLFAHMAPQAAAPWTARGFTAATTQFSQAQRDAAPCANYTFDPSSDQFIHAR